ncbi:MAG: hypothetical protein DHS20C14_09930 [Phycisphaeraceae bacterium]|nr:MAG: hypothetical protein DHS20C14_09930 [Phycisphaeraceae bacterium]
MPSKLVPVIVLGTALLAAGISTFALITLRPPATPAAEQPPYEPVVPEFDLIDQHGAPADETILDGHYTLLDFMFTSCPLWCPGMTQTMAQVQDATQGTGLRLLSISIDGDHDTPERMGMWARSYDADPDRWAFFTGDPAHVWGVVGALGFDVSPDEDLDITRADGVTAPSLNHPTRLLLVAPDRRVIGMYSYQDEAAIQELIERVRTLDADTGGP